MGLKAYKQEHRLTIKGEQDYLMARSFRPFLESVPLKI